MKRKLIVGFIILMPNLLLSQVVNVEGKRQSDEKGWSGSTLFSFDYNRSAQIDWEFNNTTYLQWDNDRCSILLLNEINIDKAGGAIFENDGFQHLRFSGIINPTFTSETFIQNQFDPVRRIENRKLIGTGVRVKLFKKNFVGIAAFYERELLTLEPDDPEARMNNDVRLSSYLQLDFDISKNIEFLSTSYFQPNIKLFSDYRLSTESQLNFQITDHFQITNTVEVMYDSSPAPDVYKLTYRLQNGIQFTF